MTETERLEKQIESLKDKIFWLETRVDVLTKRNKEQRQWISKLTRKDHPARRAGK
jgi:peptidoglycan hydrolase CwlO-like protein